MSPLDNLLSFEICKQYSCRKKWPWWNSLYGSISFKRHPPQSLFTWWLGARKRGYFSSRKILFVAGKYKGSLSKCLPEDQQYFCQQQQHLYFSQVFADFFSLKFSCLRKIKLFFKSKNKIKKYFFPRKWRKYFPKHVVNLE